MAWGTHNIKIDIFYPVKLYLKKKSYQISDKIYFPNNQIIQWKVNLKN